MISPHLCALFFLFSSWMVGHDLASWLKPSCRSRSAGYWKTAWKRRLKDDLCYNTKRMANLTLVLLNWVLIQMSLHGAWLTLYKCEWRVYIYNKSVIWEACSLICHYCCCTLSLESEATVSAASQGIKKRGNSCALRVHVVTHFSCTVSPDEGRIWCTQCSCSRSRCVFHLYDAGKITSLVHECKFLAAHTRAAEGPGSTSCNNSIVCQRYW